MKKTEKIASDVLAICSECGKECCDGDNWKWARKHAIETGHSPTVTVTWDVWKIEQK